MTSRDETAFSLDPFTGQPAAPGKVLSDATAAMQDLDVALRAEGADEAAATDAYHAAIAPAAATVDETLAAEGVEVEPTE